MSIITLDFESPYGKGAREGHILHKFSLSGMTYEQYIRDPRFKVFGVGIKIDDGETKYYSNEVTGFNDVEIILNELFYPGNDHTLVCHNALFDGAILSWYYELSAKTYWCTQAMSRALWNQRSASLKQLCKSCYPDDESIRKGDEIVNFANVYTLDAEQDESMAAYCTNDVDVTFECLKLLWKIMPDAELAIIDMTLKMFIHPAFVLDRPRVETFLEEYNKETTGIIGLAGKDFPRSILASPAKFAARVKEVLDLDIPIIDSPTKKNPDNTKLALGKDEMVFVNFQAEHAQHQHIWNARLRVASTIDRTRAQRMLVHGDVCDLNPDGRIAAPLNYAAAHTLRWGGTNKINFQNLRRGSELRKSLLAPPGYQIVVADLSNIEGRMNAWFCKEHKMLRTFASGGDLYCDFATTVFGYGVSKKYHPDERFVGKTCILGLGYQTGAAKLKNTLYLGSKGKVNFSLDRCEDIVWNDYRGTYLQIVDGWAQAEIAIQQMYTLKPGETYEWRCLTVEPGRIRLPNGLYLNYPGLKVELDEYERPQYEYWNGKFMTNLYGGKLIENVIQALARIVMAGQLLDINHWLLGNQNKYGEEARIILTVHDEGIALAKDEYAEEVFNGMVERMSVAPDWCNDGTLILAAEGGYDTNYSK